jgi:hypothetical protein
MNLKGRTGLIKSLSHFVNVSLISDRVDEY